MTSRVAKALQHSCILRHQRGSAMRMPLRSFFTLKCTSWLWT